MLWSLCAASLCVSEETLDLRALIDEALANNPEIAASLNKRNAMWERPPQAASWEDPQLSIGVANVPTDDMDFNKIDMTMKQISLSQQIPFPGVSSLKKTVAIQEAKTSDQELAYTRLRVVRDLKKAYADLFEVNAHIATSEKNKGLLAKFVEIAQAKYEVGQGLQQDILKAQVEHSMFIERLIDFNQKRISLVAELNRLLGRESSAPITGTPELRRQPLPFSPAELETMAIDNSPVLQSLRHIIDKNEANNKLAKKMYFPSFNVSAMYGFREDYSVKESTTPAFITNADGSINNVTIRTPGQRIERDDVFSFFVGVNIPLWFLTKQNKKVAETHLLVEEAKSQYTAMQQEVFFKVRDLLAKIERADQLIELYQTGIIPQAAQSLESAIAGYRVGNVDFLTLLDSQVKLCTYEVQISSVLSEYTKDLAELEPIVGKELF